MKLYCPDLSFQFSRHVYEDDLTSSLFERLCGGNYQDTVSFSWNREMWQWFGKKMYLVKSGEGKMKRCGSRSQKYQQSVRKTGTDRMSDMSVPRLTIAEETLAQWSTGQEGEERIERWRSCVTVTPSIGPGALFLLSVLGRTHSTSSKSQTCPNGTEQNLSSVWAYYHH